MFNAFKNKLFGEEEEKPPDEKINVKTKKKVGPAFNPDVVASQLAVLQLKTIDDDRAMEIKTEKILAQWEKEKPSGGKYTLEKVMDILNGYEKKFKRLLDDRDNMQKVKEALELTEAGVNSPKDSNVLKAIEDLETIKVNWMTLSRIKKQLETLKETPWKAVNVKNLRIQLDSLGTQLSKMPETFKECSSLSECRGIIDQYQKYLVVISELKSESLKDHHWASLIKVLNIKWNPDKMILDDIWKIDFEKHGQAIMDVLGVAQGENALAEFLKQIQDTWNNYELELVNYQNKSRLIRGWDELFTLVKEDINSVNAMKLSPYFKMAKKFETEALEWEENLNAINNVFDDWIDVQRRWVYLDGIFSGSAEIKTFLPVESKNFQNVSDEFLGLMKKVQKSPRVLAIIKFPRVGKQVSGLADQLKKIQKSLGDYLERQRCAFPRFYFIGDEDLLEIIGNSKNIPRLQKHFKKMFAGLNSLKLNEDNTIITGILSREMEALEYVKAINVREFKQLNDWLNTLEKEMRVSLATNLSGGVKQLQELQKSSPIEYNRFIGWVDKYQAQLVVLAAQVTWSESLEQALVQCKGNSNNMGPVSGVLKFVEDNLNILADSVLHDQPIVRRRKLEHLVIERVHQRDVTRVYINKKVCNNENFQWLSQLRFYFNSQQTDPLIALNIRVANATFYYGFEYLGLCDRLVQTPLTDRCFLTLSQALEARLGGSPFGPAGTGKTESVKALGNTLGRFVLVFNCDETFDFLAMSRIFVGLCQVGAWGCFDEFNRLEERMLSAVSQQIQNIQEALKELAKPGMKEKGVQVEILGNQINLHPDIAIFITMNPGYAGRSNLPDNLKKLFRSIAMTQPDRKLIAQVMLYSQGFRQAEKLAGKVVPFFKLCSEQLSSQSHYDFGLRALKSVLISSGNCKRDRIKQIQDSLEDGGKSLDINQLAEKLPEQEVVIQAMMDTLVPKLISDDIPLLFSLLSDVFPGMEYKPAAMLNLRTQLVAVAQEHFLTYSDEPNKEGSLFTEKVLQLYQISCIHHGLMMVGPSGSGKSTAWRILMQALDRLEGIEGCAHVIDPKSVSKDYLYGWMDPNTREWTDGLFTKILRTIQWMIDSVRGEIDKRQWIIFDGDVDPEWVENLNSVLDDNKLLTLPNGERLAIPPNVRIMFEVENLKYATLATVSRCGMVWFSDDVVTDEMILNNFLGELRTVPVSVEDLDVEMDEEDETGAGGEVAPDLAEQQVEKEINSKAMEIQNKVADILTPFFGKDKLVIKTLNYSTKLRHVMDHTRMRALSGFFSMCKMMVSNAVNYSSATARNNRRNSGKGSTPPASGNSYMPINILEKYVPKCLIISLIWSMTGDGQLCEREALGEYLRELVDDLIELPKEPNVPIVDYEVTLDGKWELWSKRVPQVDVDADQVTGTEVVIPTMDTVRHETILYTWMSQHKPVLLCGPPGSGKTMTLFSVLRELPALEVVGLNFSSATTPELLTKTFDQYCTFSKTANGVVLAPMQYGKWIVFFCDEINLPDEDKYGTQRVISFLRQMVEHGGFYRTTDMQWVQFQNIQFVGACNPPTDPGRKPLSHRFLRHVPVVYVDYPGETSLKQIYGTFNRAVLRNFKPIANCAEGLTNAMVEFFLLTKERFTHDIQPHYIYSPREMTRWMRGVYEALKPRKETSPAILVRIWAHEALRLFQDRLIYDEERSWCDDHIDSLAAKNFPDVDTREALIRPILFSNWITGTYEDVKQDKLRVFLKEKLKKFYEEELGVPLVLFDQVLDHALRIDRVFRQPQGHLLLIGVSGAGKTTISRFVSWINGLSVFQVKVHNNYSAEDFDEDLRAVLIRSGVQNERIAFIMDETNVKDSSFLERINTLLANAEVPGLFEGEEYSKLMAQCKDYASREGHHFTTADELYRWFTHKIGINLHVVFTMNPSANGLKDRATTSPALFNRCVLNWFGDWSIEAYFQVSKEFTKNPSYKKEEHVDRNPKYDSAFNYLPGKPTLHDIVSNGFVYVHRSLHSINQYISKRGGRTAAITPRHYLDCIAQFVSLKKEKLKGIEEEKKHLDTGLKKIKETAKQVEDMQGSLAKKKTELEKMNKIANDKMKEISKQKEVCEQRKKVANEMKTAIAGQEKVINEKRAVVMKELDGVLPAVEEAKQAVSGIKKSDLAEIKSMKNPPALVKLAIEAVVTLLGESNIDWKAIQGIISKDNFVKGIIDFKAENITDEVYNKMKKNYLSQADFNFEKINRASAACGPMVKWVHALMIYREIVKQVAPMTQELDDLAEKASVNQKKANEVMDNIKQLEAEVSKIQKEHKDLMKKVEEIKNGLSGVSTKVDRSVNLLKSLSGERSRWENGADKFATEIETLLGDCLLAGAYLCYAGYYDPTMRTAMLNKWCEHMKFAGIPFKATIAKTMTKDGEEKETYLFNITTYLSTPNERMKWKENALPSDEMCQENAIILSRHKRYPLVIDPSGQATEFILNEWKDKKLLRTSFLDINFRRTLESAMRFGTPLLVQDVDQYDSILNPVLNKEIRKTGGRTVITIGNGDVDLSPTFTIFLSTRDPTVEFPQDIASRVTFVNFTVTRSILRSQCLNILLKAERPDVDAKRNDLLKLQGEFQVKLFNLEKNLLDTLSKSKGNVLENDTVIGQLETLKKEAADIALKVQSTDKILEEINEVMNNYLPLAIMCTNTYFTLDSLHLILCIYQFSLQFFFDIIDFVLVSKDLGSEKDYTKRLAIITKNFFYVTYQRVGRGMMFSDRLTLPVQLVQIFMRSHPDEADYRAEFDHLLKGKSGLAPNSDIMKTGYPEMTESQRACLAQLSNLKSFSQLASKLCKAESSFSKWLTSATPEENVPEVWDDAASTTKIGAAIYSTLFIQTLRPDRLVASMSRLTTIVFRNDFLEPAQETISIPKIFINEIKLKMPILLFSSQGFDPSTQIEDLAKVTKIHLANIAIGSAEGFTQAEKAINVASSKGSWVMLKNAHLAPQWLGTMAKQVESIQNAHKRFQLFITLEISNKLPSTLIRDSRMIMHEPPPGVKDNMRRILDILPEERFIQPPAIRARLYCLFIWLHAVVQERMRYVPLGWSKKYEFTESEIRFSCDTIDTWLQLKETEKTGAVPLEPLTNLLSMCIYGGKVDNDFDQQLFESMVNHILSDNCVKPSFVLVDGSEDRSSTITLPSITSKGDAIKWINDLPNKQTPLWLGLPNNAENLLLCIRAQSILGALGTLNPAMEEEDEIVLELSNAGTYSDNQNQGNDRPEWMNQLKENADDWLNSLPTYIKPLQRTVENIKDPMYRCFEREVNMGGQLLSIVREDLTQVQQVLSGEIKSTNPIRIMMSNLSKGMIPMTWKQYKVPASITLLQWIQDFILRLSQFEKASDAAQGGGPPALREFEVWLGGLFMPEAYITATRQSVAQSNQWALEELVMDVSFLDKKQAVKDGFLVSGLILMGGKASGSKKITLTTELECQLPLVVFKWIQSTNKSTPSGLTVNLPLYVTPDRAILLYTLTFDSDVAENSFYKRGVAILASNLG